MSDNQISNILSNLLIFMLGILGIFVIIFIVLKIKERNENKPAREQKNNEIKAKENEENQLNKKSINEFMEFDSIIDSMIYNKRLRKYVMVIESQGINYDLMSGIEKNGVEAGFLQFLNTLRAPIQIYVQTRTVNLSSSISIYKERINRIKDKLIKKQMEYQENLDKNSQNNEEQKKLEFEIIRLKNLYEYGLDIVNNTDKMSMNKNILRRHYYIIISYSQESVNGQYDEEEIRNIAFNELYTRAQAIINSLRVCSINSKVLDSIQLSELLYVAYNRDDSEIYNLNKMINSGYYELYSTAEDILKKRERELDKYIREEALKRANEAVLETVEKKEKEREIETREREKENLIQQMAQIILDENETLLGRDLKLEAEKNLTKKKGVKKQNEK